MARKKEMLPELKRKKPTELTEMSFAEAKEKYLANVSQLVATTDFMALRSNPVLWINNNIVKQMDYFKERMARRDNYWDENQLREAFEMLIDITNLLVDKVRYQPQIGDFCRIIGITQHTFNAWTNENNERGEQARYIQDYFKSMLLQAMATGDINPVAGSFIGKTTLGMKEDVGTQVNVNVIGSDLTLDQIMENYEKNRKS